MTILNRGMSVYFHRISVGYRRGECALMSDYAYRKSQTICDHDIFERMIRWVPREFWILWIEHSYDIRTEV